MDLRRHITAGRLSELVGPSGLETDKVIRTLGWRRVAEAELPMLAPETRQYLQAYADGVNAYIDSQGSPSRMALEYVVLGQQVKNYRVERWTPADSLAWLKAMAWDLRGDYQSELTRARLSGGSRPRRSTSCTRHTPMPSTSRSSPRRTGGRRPRPPPQRCRGQRRRRRCRCATAPGLVPRRRMPRCTRRCPRSPSRWVAAGASAPTRGSCGPEKSSTGKPLLANDPHLAVGIPGIWYQVGLHCRTVGSECPFDVSGFSFAGLPGVVIGHNQQIAWGFTNLDPDVTDFYLEQVRGDTYLRDGKYVALEERTETIKIAGEGDHTMTVRSTVHGPLVSDVIDPVGEGGERAPVSGRPSAGTYEVALAWTGLIPSRTADAIFGLNTATNFEEFRDGREVLRGAQPEPGLRRHATATSATRPRAWSRSGDPTPPARCRASGPCAGWRSTWDWKGFVDFEDMPWAYNPPEGLIVTANQAVTASPTPFLTTQWDYGFRSSRIRSLLEREDKITPERMAQIQGDTRSEFAPTLVKRLLEVELGSDEFTKEGQDLLRGWDYSNPIGRSDSSASAAYFNAVWANLVELTFNDELPDDLRADGGDQWMQTVTELLDKPRSPWWDNKLTPGVTEGEAEILRQALVEARLDLTKELGKDPASWEWGKLHDIRFTHKVLGGDDVPAAVRKLFNRGPVPLPGGSAIVNANGWDASQGFGVTYGPSMRMVVDLGNLDRSRWVNQTGNSGHAFHDHYDDQVEAWAKNETFPWPFSEKAVREASGETLQLVPGAAE